MNLDAIQSIMEQLIEQTCSDNLRLYRNDRVCCIETSISLLFYGGELTYEEAYRLRVTYSDIRGVLKPEGELEIMYLQYLFDTFLTMAKEYRRTPK